MYPAERRTGPYGQTEPGLGTAPATPLQSKFLGFTVNFSLLIFVCSENLSDATSLPTKGDNMSALKKG